MYGVALSPRKLRDQVTMRTYDPCCKQREEMIGANDLLIAAHARALGLTLVTNNEREFRRVPGLVVENWIEAH